MSNWHSRTRGLRLVIPGNNDASTSSQGTETDERTTIERHDRGMSLLRKHISLNAFEDHSEDGESASENLSAHDQVVLEQIKSWLQDAEQRRQLLWINNLPSTTRSAKLATQNSRTIEQIEKICRDGGILGASFSFSRFKETITSQADVEKTRMSLFPTLAYQLAVHMPHVAAKIAAVGIRDPAVFSRSLLSQMTELIAKPLLRSTGFTAESEPPLQPKVVIIDGLVSREGKDEAGTKEIVEAIDQCLEGFKVPIGFIVGTGPSGKANIPRRYSRETK